MKQLGLIIVVSLLLLARAAWAQSLAASGIELNAKNISRDYETRTVTLEGDILIKIGNERMTADRATINMRKQEIIAEGHVVLESEVAYVEAEKLRYNYNTRLGVIEKGLVQSGQVVFLGDMIRKESEKKYVATDATYTSCRTCPPAWSFSGSEIEAEIGGYAYIKYPILRVANFPVFILPRMLVPLKSTRQSGVLVPSLDFSKKGGTAVTLPYYWAINQSSDLTYSIKNYERRGFKQMAEYRYVIDEDSGGRLHGAFMRDTAFTDDGQPNDVTESFRRGYLSYEHRYELPNDFVHRMRLNTVTDLRYPRDFSDEMDGHGDPALESSMSVTRNGESYQSSIEAAHYVGLLKKDTDADNSDAVHRFPEIRYSLMERELWESNLFFRFDFNYTNFARRDFGYDDIAGNAPQPRDGEFNPDTDLIRTGHRYIFQPTVSYPFHIGTVIDVNPSIMYNETQYRFNADPATTHAEYDRNAERRYVQTDISFKTKYSRVFDLNDSYGGKLKHEIEPELSYSKIPWVERPDHVFFGNFEDQPYSRRFEPVGNADFFGDSRLQFDYRDRLFDKDIATFTLSNYLIRKKIRNGESSYQKIATVRLSQSYDFNNARTEDPHPWSMINGLVDVRLNNFETHTIADYYPYAKITNWSSRMKFMTQWQNYFEIRYSEIFVVDENNTFDRDERTETVGFGIGYKGTFMDLIGRTNYSIVNDTLESWEYQALFKPPGDCWSIKFGHKKTLGSDVVFKFSFNFEFGGDV